MWEWDESKRAATLLLRGLDFSSVANFDLAASTIEPDLRCDYGEQRFHALGVIHGRLYSIVFTPRGSKFRLISLRKANKREQRRWENR